MPEQQDDLKARITALQAEFQRVADSHPWVCLAIPPLGGNNVAALFVGEKCGPAAPEWGFRGVRTPPDRQREAVIDHVNVLTFRAHELLLLVLKGPNQIPTDTQEQIRAADRKCFGNGWVYWLWYAAPMQHVNRTENYPQVAATALWELRDYCSEQPAKEPKEEANQWLTLAQAETLSGVNRGTISRAVDTGLLKSNGQSGKGKRKVDAADFARWQLERAKRPEQTESQQQVERLLKKASKE
jgi:hypothetical protein